MEFRKWHFSLTKSQKFEKLYKINIFKRRIIYIMVKYVCISIYIGAVRAFSVLLKSAPIALNFG